MALNQGRGRVAMLAAYDVPHAGSFVPAMLSVLGEARRRGRTVEVVLPLESRDFGWIDELSAAEIPLRFVPKHPRRAAAKALAAAWRDDVPTVLHTHFTNYDLPALGVKRARQAPTFVVWHSHDSFPASVLLRARRRAKFALAGHGVSAALFVGIESAIELSGRGVPAERVLHVPNAVDASRFRLAAPAQAERARAELGLPVGPAVLLHFGWSWHRKGGDLFVEAVRVLRSRGIDVVGVTIGGGEEARLHAALEGVSDAIFVGQPVETASRLYEAADVFVSCSRSEGDPYSVLEAAAAGLGTVVSVVPGQDGAKGPPTLRRTTLDPDDIADAVASLVSREPAVKSDDARAARGWVEENADIATYGRLVADVYDRLLGGVQLGPTADVGVAGGTG